ncbi:MAG: ribosomal protein S18-alanine N-acetyltransferase [Candidatus Izemoplasmataceae bacterium]
MNPNLLIRKMDLSDIDFVYENEMEIFNKSLSKKTLYDELLYNKLAYYFMALVDQKRVGYVGVWITEPNAEIMNIFVVKDYRKNHIGKALMHHVIDLCLKHQVKSLTLEVRASNQEAIKFYETIGFNPVTRRKHYYSDGEDALLMLKELEVKS